MAQVLIVMGSDSDLKIMSEAAKVLKEFGLDSEITVASAHRAPERAHNLATNAARRGIRVIIAGAGVAAHLAGVLAASTALPVIGVPIASGPLQGQDALLATVQMPPGIPVATVAINGAKNAGILAAQIIGSNDPEIQKKILDYKTEMKNVVEQKASRLEEIGYENYLKGQVSV